MADTTRRVLCRTCGKEVSVYDAKQYPIGRRTLYECIKCAEQGDKEVYYYIARKSNKEREKW